MRIGRLLSVPLRAAQGATGKLADLLDAEPAVAQDPASPRRLDELLRALRHRSGAVRARAAQELGQLELQEGAEELVHAARDTRREVRRAALGALLRLDPDRFAETAFELSQTVSATEMLADLDAIVERES